MRPRLFLLLLFFSVGGLPAAETIRLEGRAGLGGRTRLAAWTQVEVGLELPAGAPAECEALLFSGEGPALTSRRVPPGEGRKTLTLLARPFSLVPPIRIEVRAQGGAKAIAEAELEFPEEADGALVVLVGEDRCGWAESLAAEAQGLTAWREEESGDDWIPNPTSAALARMTQEAMPDSWPAWSAADAVIWDSPQPERLRPAQWRALVEWVEGGGRLLLLFPAEGRLETSGFPPGFLPAEPGAAAGAAPETDGMLLPAILASCTGRWTATAGPKLADGESVLCRELAPSVGRSYLPPGQGPEGRPIAVRAARGFGSVTMMGLDWRRPGEATRKARSSLLGRLLGLPLAPDGLLAVMREVRGREFSSAPRLDTLALADLEATPGVEPAPFAWIAAFLLAYALAVGPFDAWLRARGGRRAWTRLFLLVLLFSSVAWTGARWLRGGRSHARAIAVRDEAGGTVREHLWLGLYSAEERRLDLRTGPGLWPCELASRKRMRFLPGMDDEELPEAEPGGRLRMDGPELAGTPFAQWSLRRFRSEGLRSEPGWIEGGLRFASGRLEGSFRVRAPAPLEEAILLSRGRAWRIGRLEPGAEWRAAGAGSGEPLLGALAALAEPAGRAGALEPWIAAGLRLLVEGWQRLDLMRRSQAEEGAGDADALSLEQWWSARRIGRREADGADLSDPLREGGVLLIARVGRVPAGLVAKGLDLQTDGWTLLRAVFPAGPKSDGGKAAFDDLYGIPYETLRKPDGP